MKISEANEKGEALAKKHWQQHYGRGLIQINPIPGLREELVTEVIRARKEDRQLAAEVASAYKTAINRKIQNLRRTRNDSSILALQETLNEYHEAARQARDEEGITRLKLYEHPEYYAGRLLAAKHWSKHYKDGKIMTAEELPEIHEELKTIKSKKTISDYKISLKRRMHAELRKNPNNPELLKLKKTIWKYFTRLN